MGLKIVIPGVSFPDTLPLLQDDVILPEAGALLLMDATHEAGAWAEGVPASAATFPNIAWEQAATLLGAGDATTLQPSISYTAAINNLTKGKIERTTKGGLHGIVSKANALAAGDGMVFRLPAAIRTYIKNNPTHAFYLSAWDYLTRANTGVISSNGAMQYEIGNGNTSILLTAIRADAAFGQGLLSRFAPGLNTVGNRFFSVGVTSSTLSVDTNVPGGPTWGALSGTYNGAVLASRNNFWPSFVFYRMYLEDLTVSGRTWAQVDAIDFAEYSNQVLTPGGRYYGDTFTDPATIP